MALSQKLMTRYNELKQQVPHCILLMQVGAFMQVMNDDAQTVSKVCHIKLQMGGNPEQPFVFGGFPKSAINKYVGQLVRANYSVAIAIQDDAKERHIEEIIRVQIEKPLLS